MTSFENGDLAELNTSIETLVLAIREVGNDVAAELKNLTKAVHNIQAEGLNIWTE